MGRRGRMTPVWKSVMAAGAAVQAVARRSRLHSLPPVFALFAPSLEHRFPDRELLSRGQVARPPSSLYMQRPIRCSGAARGGTLSLATRAWRPSPPLTVPKRQGNSPNLQPKNLVIGSAEDV